MKKQQSFYILLNVTDSYILVMIVCNFSSIKQMIGLLLFMIQ